MAQQVNQPQPKQAAKAYQVPKGEEGLVHARIIREEYDPKTGKPLFKAFVQKWNPAEWANFLRAPHGYTVQEVLHDPAKGEAPGE